MTVRIQIINSLVGADLVSAPTHECSMNIRKGDPMNDIHLIGNAHIDPVWLWRWQEGFHEIKATFRSALDRMRESDDFVFTSACASYFEWILENDPAMFQEIQERVRQGRFCIVGGWWLQPDCNVPSGESFARHALYAQRFFKEHFGLTAQVGYNVDSFGHNGNLPQLLRLGGLSAYVMMRPEQHEKELPPVFLWEGVDGTCIPTAKILNSYALSGFLPRQTEDKMRRIMETADRQELPIMLFYGVGNHGGGPTVSLLSQIRDVRERLGRDRFLFSDPVAYFDAIQGRQLPVVRGDLQHHASGCYSAMSEIKALNRRAENRLVSAERMQAVAHRLLNLPVDISAMRRAWTDVLFNQFHDIMGGCSIRQAYDDAREWYGEALTIGARALNAARQRISWNIDTQGDRTLCTSKDFHHITWEQEQGGVPIVVFNPHPWEVTAPVELSYGQKAVTDESGAPVSVQSIRASRTNGDDNWNSAFLATLPPMGYRVFYGFVALGKESPAAPREELSAGNTSIENEYLRVTIDPCTGFLRSLFDRKNGCDVLCGQSAAIVINDFASDTWAHGITEFRDEAGRFSGARLETIERGPVRATIRATSTYGASTLTQDYTLYRGVAQLFVRATLNWQETHSMLKLSFPVSAEHPVATYEIPFGHIQREANGQEESGHSWLDVGDSARGLTLLNDSKYSYDVLENDLRMTVARSALFADHFGRRDGQGEYLDIGIQHFSYALLPRAAALRPSVATRAAQELNQPLYPLFETYHKGALPLTCAFASVAPDNVILSAIKRAEDDDGYVLRLCEMDGKACRAILDLPGLRASAETGLNAHEVKTLKLSDDGNVQEVDFMEWTQ